MSPSPSQSIGAADLIISSLDALSGNAERRGSGAAYLGSVLEPMLTIMQMPLLDRSARDEVEITIPVPVDGTDYGVSVTVRQFLSFLEGAVRPAIKDVHIGTENALGSIRFFMISTCIRAGNDIAKSITIDVHNMWNEAHTSGRWDGCLCSARLHELELLENGIVR